MLIAFGIWDTRGWDSAVLVAISAGLFILPFALFTPLAGNLSDKIDKSLIIRTIKALEIPIILAAIIVLFWGHIYMALLILFLLGAQSAFFSPCKFAILPQHLKSTELIAGNAFVTAGTYIAILLGSILGALIALQDYGLILTALLALAAALSGYAAARLIPAAPPPAPELQISWNILNRIKGVTKDALTQKTEVRIAILAVSFFYFLAATFHAQFPNFTRQELGADNTVVTAFMIAFSFGVAIGGFLNHKLLSARTDGRWTPIACVMMGAFGVDIYVTGMAYPAPTDGTLNDLSAFISNAQGIRLLFDTFMQALACGFYVVPLRAIVQARSEKKNRARVISGSNMLDALFILASSALSTTLLANGFTILELFLTVSIMALCAGFILLRSKSIRSSDV